MKIPNEKMKPAIDRWIQFGEPPPIAMGSFIRAALTHDLMAAAMFADDVNRPLLADWAMFIYNELPAGSHGSAKDLERWHENGGTRRVQYAEVLLRCGGCGAGQAELIDGREPMQEALARFECAACRRVGLHREVERPEQKGAVLGLAGRGLAGQG